MPNNPNAGIWVRLATMQKVRGAYRRVLRVARVGLIKFRPGLIALSAIALLALFGWAIAFLPPRLLGIDEFASVAAIPDPKDQVKAVSDLRTALIQAVAGIGLAATLYFSARTLQ